MKSMHLCGILALAVGAAAASLVHGQARPDPSLAPNGPGSLAQTLLPDPKEIPVPEIKTAFPKLPGVMDLPDRPEMPDVMTMNDGTKVTTPEQWAKRRVEMRDILEYYGLGHAPPPPGNVKGMVVNDELQNDGKVRYRLIHLTFGPDEKLTLDFGIYTPATGGPYPTVITPMAAPGGQRQPAIGMGPNPGGGDLLAIPLGEGGDAGGGGGFGGGRGGRGGFPGADGAPGGAMAERLLKVLRRPDPLRQGPRLQGAEVVAAAVVAVGLGERPAAAHRARPMLLLVGPAVRREQAAHRGAADAGAGVVERAANSLRHLVRLKLSRVVIMWFNIIRMIVPRIRGCDFRMVRLLSGAHGSFRHIPVMTGASFAPGAGAHRG